jgi:DNA-binding response OmpR family regulator
MKPRILLVDDDQAVLLTLRAVLEMNGFAIDTAGNAEDAIAQLARERYEIVISDSHMETEDSGFRVIQAARQQSYKPATAMLTAYPPVELRHGTCGGDAVLLKPLGTQELLRQIAKLLERRESRGEAAPTGS